MPLSINYVVIHKLNKERYKDKADKSDIATTLLDPNDSVTHRVIENIQDVYGEKENRVNYGIVSNEAKVTTLENYYKNVIDAESKKDSKGDVFLKMTCKLMKEIETAACERMATGGYIVFSDFLSKGERYFLTTMVKDKSGINFQGLKPVEAELVDLDKLHQAFRVNFTNLAKRKDENGDLNDTVRYVSFVARSEAAANYFVDAFGAEVDSNSTQSTKNIIKYVYEFSDNVHGEGFYKKNGAETRKAFYDYLTNEIGVGNKITLDNVRSFLDRHVVQEQLDNYTPVADNFIKTLNAGSNVIPYEFTVDKNEVKKSNRLKVTSKENWALEFEKGAVSSEESSVMYYNKKTKKLVLDLSSEESIIKRIENQMFSSIENINDENVDDEQE